MKRRDFLGSAVAVMPLLAFGKISDQVGFDGQWENIELEKGEKHMENRSEVKELKVIDLPAPEKTGGKTVVEALWLRRTVRDIKPDALPLQTLSNLLWAAYGLNRPAGTMMRGKAGRTAASARLAAWFHNCDREKTPKEFKLKPDQKVLFAMTVGQSAAAATSSRR